MHPRFIHFPWQADYSAQSNIFAPYVMALAEPNYSSESLSTDGFGFRIQYDTNGRKIDLSTAKHDYKSCILLLGNSTSFGVSLSGDDKTIGRFFGRDAVPCINLSVRGATMQQELAIFSNFKPLLPKPERIIVLTGICDISLATQPEDIFSPVLGGMHSAAYYNNQFFEKLKSTADKSGDSLADIASRQISRIPLIAKIKEWHRTSPLRVAPTNDVFSDNLAVAISVIKNCIETWGWIQKGSGIKVDIVMQPVLGWAKKQPSKIETQCIKTDRERIPAISLYVNDAIYQIARKTFSDACAANEIGFLDANEFFGADYKADDTIFTDICHLSDNGTEILGKKIATRLGLDG